MTSSWDGNIRGFSRAGGQVNRQCYQISGYSLCLLNPSGQISPYTLVFRCSNGLTASAVTAIEGFDGLWNLVVLYRHLSTLQRHLFHILLGIRHNHRVVDANWDTTVRYWARGGEVLIKTACTNKGGDLRTRPNCQGWGTVMCLGQCAQVVKVEEGGLRESQPVPTLTIYVRTKVSNSTIQSVLKNRTTCPSFRYDHLVPVVRNPACATSTKGAQHRS